MALFLHERSAQLSAGAVNVSSHFSSNSNIYSTFFKQFLKSLDILSIRGTIAPLFYWIDRDEPGIDRNFVYTEYVPVEKEILHRYSVEGFLEEVFAEEQPSDLHETQEENNALY